MPVEPDGGGAVGRSAACRPLAMGPRGFKVLADGGAFVDLVGPI
ncbi:MAG: hypothetical protein ACR2L8_06760 [Solirubrobacteraceae bacterium]